MYFKLCFNKIYPKNILKPFYTELLHGNKQTKFHIKFNRIEKCYFYPRKTQTETTIIQHTDTSIHRLNHKQTQSNTDTTTYKLHGHVTQPHLQT